MRVKTALVTGAGKGIGSGIALCLAEAGYDVAIHYFGSSEGAEQVAKQIREMGRKALTLKADITQVGQIQSLFQQFHEAWGPIDLLVNNAGITKRASFLETSEELFDLLINTDFKGAYFCAQTAARNMVEKGTQGVIINISSNHSTGNWPRASAYAAGKAALNKVTQNAAFELARYGIRVLTIAPGYTTKDAEKPASYEVETSKRIPLGRFCTSKEIGKAVVYLASEDAGYITGTVLNMDGGALLPVFADNDFGR